MKKLLITIGIVVFSIPIIVVMFALVLSPTESSPVTTTTPPAAASIPATPPAAAPPAAKSSPATPPVAPAPIRKPVATDGSAFEDICENWFFYRDRTLRLAQAGDEEGAAKARKQLEQNERWLSDYPGRTLPATKSGCR